MESVERKTILTILKDYLNNTNSDLGTFDVDELYRISETIKVSSIIAYIFNKNNKHYEKFDKRLLYSINVFERTKYIKENITKALQDNKYDFVFVKGMEIGELYKEPYLRVSNDLDIVVKGKDYQNIIDLFTNELGYKCKHTTIQECALVKDGMYVDLHRTFMYDNDSYEKLFKDCFNSTHKQDNNLKYMYLLAHGSKHLLLGELDYCFFLDLYYLRKLVEKKLIEKLCKEYNLDLFDKAVNSYLDALLGTKDYNNLDHKIENYIFSCAEDGISKNRVLINKSNKNTTQYLFRRVFPKYRIMSYEYPILTKHKILLPLCYIRRIIRILKSSRNKLALEEVKNNVTLKKEGIIEMDKFINELGLKRIED